MDIIKGVLMSLSQERLLDLLEPIAKKKAQFLRVGYHYPEAKAAIERFESTVITSFDVLKHSRDNTMFLLETRLAIENAKSVLSEHRGWPGMLSALTRGISWIAQKLFGKKTDSEIKLDKFEQSILGFFPPNTIGSYGKISPSLAIDIHQAAKKSADELSTFVSSVVATITPENAKRQQAAYNMEQLSKYLQWLGSDEFRGTTEERRARLEREEEELRRTVERSQPLAPIPIIYPPIDSKALYALAEQTQTPVALFLGLPIEKQRILSCEKDGFLQLVTRANLGVIELLALPDIKLKWLASRSDLIVDFITIININPAVEQLCSLTQAQLRTIVFDTESLEAQAMIDSFRESTVTASLQLK